MFSVQQCLFITAVVLIRTSMAQQHPKCRDLPDKCYENSPCDSNYYCCVDGQKFDEWCDSGRFFNEIAAVCEQSPECMPTTPGSGIPASGDLSSKDQHVEFCTGEIDGQYPLGPNVCSRAYYICTAGVTTNGHCKPELRFDIVSHLCEIPELVDACDNIPAGQESLTTEHLLKTTTSSPGLVEGIASAVTDLFETSTLTPFGENFTSVFNETSIENATQVTSGPGLVEGVASAVTDLFESTTLKPVGENFTSIFNASAFNESSIENATQITSGPGLVEGLASAVTDLFGSTTLKPVGENFTSVFNASVFNETSIENTTQVTMETSSQPGLVAGIASAVTDLFETSTSQQLELNVTSSINGTAFNDTSIENATETALFESTARAGLVEGIGSGVTGLFESTTLQSALNITEAFNDTSIANGTETIRADNITQSGLMEGIGSGITELFENATMHPTRWNFTSDFNATAVENATETDHFNATSLPNMADGVGSAITGLFENSKMEPLGWNFTSPSNATAFENTTKEVEQYSDFILNFDCMSRADGNYPDLDVPCTSRYLRCKNEVTEIRTCKNGKMFDDITLRCKHPSHVASCGGQPTFDEESSDEEEESFVDEFCRNRTSGNFRDPDNFCTQHFFTCTEDKKMSTGWCPFEQYYYPEKDACMPMDKVPDCLNRTMNETQMSGVNSTESTSTSGPVEIPKQIFDCSNKKRGNYRDPWRTCSPTFYSCTKSGKTMNRKCYEDLFYDPTVNRCVPFELSPICTSQLPPSSTLAPTKRR